jgi:Flp pilus assembly pilin Flp
MFAIVRLSQLRRLHCLRREGGQGMIEYAAIVALISVAALAVIVLVA